MSLLRGVYRLFLDGERGRHIRRPKQRLERHNGALSVVSYQLSVVSYPLSVVSYQLSVISYQLTGVLVLARSTDNG